jgi:hypothetical protein
MTNARNCLLSIGAATYKQDLLMTLKQSRVLISKNRANGMSIASPRQLMVVESYEGSPSQT